MKTNKYPDRLKSNLEILSLLKNFFEKNPDLRFGQGLIALGINLWDQFYIEPEKTLEDLKTKIDSSEKS